MSTSLTRCQNGHFYSPEQHSSCPYCGVDLGAGPTRRKGQAAGTPTAPAGRSGAGPSADAPTMPAGGATAGGATAGGAAAGGAATPVPKAAADKTVRLSKQKHGIDPVVGWLVCVEGPDRGRDYRIRTGRNKIGRGEHMDICIRGDQTIHTANHASVVYEPRRSAFVLLPGDQQGLVYLNDEAVYESRPLTRGDVVELGQTRLHFVPLCGEDFRWTEEEA